MKSAPSNELQLAPVSSAELAPPAPSTALATAPAAAPVAAMLQAALDKGITADNVAAVEKLVDLYERMQEKDAERQFAAAFADLQSELPPIDANKPVPNKDGTIRYKYAPFEDIMAAVRPFLLKHGFSVTFSSDIRDGRVIQTCTLQHRGGHKRSNQFMARIGNGPPSSSEAQADGAAATYAQRQAFCDALNITISHQDNDARIHGKPIPEDHVAYLKELVKETKTDEKTFLAFAGADCFESIGIDRYDACVRELNRKKMRGQQ